MARSVSLTRTPYRNEGGTFRYVYTAVGTDTPSEVFVMIQGTLDPTRQTRVARYSSVANPQQMDTLPVNAPVAGESFYRTATFEVPYTDRESADEDWEALQAAVRYLVRALVAADSALAAQTVVITA